MLCKLCLGCFDATGFYDGYNVCKTCCNLRDKKYHADHRVERSAYNKEYNKSNKKKISRYHQAYRDAHRATLAAKRALRAAKKREKAVSLGLTRFKTREVSDVKKFLVRIWIGNHPESTIKQCSIGANVSWRTAKKYMEELKNV